MYEGECKSVTVMAQKIAADLQRRYPDAEAELYFTAGFDAKPTATHGPLQTVLTCFCQSCSAYDEAWVRYHPEHADGIVVKMVGHCGRRNDSCTRMCRNFRDRPRTIIALRRTGQNRAGSMPARMPA